MLSRKSFWNCTCLHLEHMIICASSRMSDSMMYDYSTWQKICFCIKLFTSLEYNLWKIFCLKLLDILVNLRKISTGLTRNLTGNLHHLALILAPDKLLHTRMEVSIFKNPEKFRAKFRDSHGGPQGENCDILKI